MIALNKLPNELLIMIINLSSFKYHSFNIAYCSECSKPLCNEHAIKAKRWGKQYKCHDDYLMCNTCCWSYICVLFNESC